MQYSHVISFTCHNNIRIRASALKDIQGRNHPSAHVSRKGSQFFRTQTRTSCRWYVLLVCLFRGLCFWVSVGCTGSSVALFPSFTHMFELTNEIDFFWVSRFRSTQNIGTAASSTTARTLASLFWYSMLRMEFYCSSMKISPSILTESILRYFAEVLATLYTTSWCKKISFPLILLLNIFQ